jgi:hypothetical protein
LRDGVELSDAVMLRVVLLGGLIRIIDLIDGQHMNKCDKRDTDTESKTVKTKMKGRKYE